MRRELEALKHRDKNRTRMFKLKFFFVSDNLFLVYSDYSYIRFQEMKSDYSELSIFNFSSNIN